MSPPSFLVEPTILQGVDVGSAVVLDAATVHHIRVARIHENENVQAVDGQGNRYMGQVSKGEVLHVTEVIAEPRPPLHITVAQALIKEEDRLLRAIEMMTEVGVMSFIPWQAERSIVAWSREKAQRNHAKWVKVVRRATEQSRRAFLPSVEPLAVGTQVATRITDFDHVVLLEEFGGAPDLAPISGKILVVIGPEGGISVAERQAFAGKSNVHSLTLGNNVLRSATAGIVGVTYLLVRSGAWNGRTPEIVKG